MSLDNLFAVTVRCFRFLLCPHKKKKKSLKESWFLNLSTRLQSQLEVLFTDPTGLQCQTCQVSRSVVGPENTHEKPLPKWPLDLLGEPLI